MTIYCEYCLLLDQMVPYRHNEGKNSKFSFSSLSTQYLRQLILYIKICQNVFHVRLSPGYGKSELRVQNFKIAPLETLQAILQQRPAKGKESE